MPRTAFVATVAGLMVIAPALLDRVVDSAASFFVFPLLPGLYVAAWTERLGLLVAMDASGDLTLLAAIIMYVASFALWFMLGWAGLRHLQRAHRGADEEDRLMP